MKFVLTTPPFDLFKEGYGSKWSIRRGYLPPLGIGYVAGATMKAGIDTFLLDPSVLGLDFEKTLRTIASFKPDVVGISTITGNQPQSFRLADMLKEKLGVTVIMGGPHATCFSEEVARACRSVDYVVAGEGEKAIVPLLQRIQEKRKPYDVKGVTFMDGDTVVSNEKAEIECDLNNLEPLPRHLYRNELYTPLPYAYRRLPANVVITSRGCPYSKCAFCFSAGKMKERYRRFSPERVVGEIQDLIRRYRVREILFFDDNFLIQKRWVMEFCDLMEKGEIDVTWSCLGRVDTVDFEMLKRVASVGCWSIFYGLESGVQRLLDIIEKGITIEQIKQAIAWTHAAGIETRGSFMLALPGETPADALTTIEFSVSLDLDYAQFSATFPDPGTKMYDIALAQGKLRTYRGIARATYVPDGYKDEVEVERIVNLAYRRFYFRPNYIIKRIRSIRNLSDIYRYIEGFLFVKGLCNNLRV
jgi:radical SAM superfamily enzyme YgiQ (UPF0313 family)